MDLTTSGRFRVFDNPREPSSLLLVDVEPDDPDAADAYEPTSVAADGYEGDLAETVASLEPGTVVDATLTWTNGDARFESVAVETESVVEFVDGATNLFEAATETWEAALAAGDGMNSRVTRDTDGDPNGVLYVFAEQEGARDLFEEFRTGTLPLEPLIARVNEGYEPGPREVFVMRPAAHPFVLVYILLQRGGMLSRTVRDTYDV
jgi:hypothetical protein